MTKIEKAVEAEEQKIEHDAEPKEPEVSIEEQLAACQKSLDTFAQGINVQGQMLNQLLARVSKLEQVNMVYATTLLELKSSKDCGGCGKCK